MGKEGVEGEGKGGRERREREERRPEGGGVEGKGEG